MGGKVINIGCTIKEYILPKALLEKSKHKFYADFCTGCRFYSITKINKVVSAKSN